jgi:hypothetical protein
MKIKCAGWYGSHEHDLKDMLILNSVSVKSFGVEARLELRCPDCGAPGEYITLRRDFVVVSKEE